MASPIRHPLRSICVIKVSVIVWVLCLCIAMCHSEDLVLKRSHKRESQNSSKRLHNAKKEENGCHTICHPNTEEHEDDKATINKYDLDEQPSTNGSSRQPRSIAEDIQKTGHQREGRAGALNKNFLRFGRGNLNKNFLRFGRGGNLKQNFLRFGRGGLQKNFLRFGRKDGEYDLSSGEKSDFGVKENSQNFEESSDLRSSASNADNVMKALDRMRSELYEKQEDSIEQQENGASFAEMEADSHTQGPEAFEIEENGEKVKRGLQHKHNMFSGKRGSLNRNFLRFGKRSVPLNEEIEEGGSQEESGIKVKREVGLVGAVKDEEPIEKLHMQRNKKGVLFLASPWLNKTLSSQTKEQRSIHGDSIRRRSLDAKLLSRLHSNFIRFGRR